MRVTNSNTFSATSQNALCQMPKPMTFPDGKHCERAEVELQISLTSTDASPYNLTNADVLSIANKVCTAWTLQFGDRSKDLVDATLSFALLRLLNWMMTGRDMLVGKPGTVNMVEIQNYPSGGQNLTVPATGGGSLTFNLVLMRPFLYEPVGGIRCDDWCPGTHQMRQMDLSFISTLGLFSTDAAKVTPTGNVTVTYLTAEGESQREVWAKVPRIFQTNQTSLEIKLGEGGALLGLAEQTTTGFATNIGVLSLLAQDKPDVHTMVQAQRIVQETAYKIPEGGLDPNNLVCVLFSPDRNARVEDLPISEQYTFKAANQDVSPFQLVWLIAPKANATYAEQTVRPNLNHGDQNGAGKDILAANAFALNEENHASGYAACSPIAIVLPDDPDFHTTPGQHWV